MNKLLLFLLLLFSIPVFSQNIHGVVTDSVTHQALPYATVFYNQKKRFLYTDSAGRFTIPRDSLIHNDSLYVQFLGYKQLSVPVVQLKEENVLRMIPQTETLEPVTVTNCRKLKNYILNKHAGIAKNYMGPGPETKIIIAGRYVAKKQRRGYVKQIRFYDETFNGTVVVPVRLRWYEWNAAQQLPGKELTNKNIIVYTYKKGWNSFDIPDTSIYFPAEGIVFGLEFIYPVEFANQYKNLSSAKEKLQWLSDMNHRWSLGMQLTRDEQQKGFYGVNNEPFQSYDERGKGYYIKPAIKFVVAHCVK
ncbi:MAG: carboxypeptidase-like regulatory domain-containing protein [Ilyomonas sp.]